MSRVTNMVGWIVRGGDQTREDLALKSAAIQELQQQVAELRAELTSHVAGTERARAEAEGAANDLAGRTGAIVERLDRLDGLVADHDDAVASLSRVVAAPEADG